GTTACANRKIDLTLTAMSRSNSASSTSSMGRRTWLMPALLTRMSIPPNASTVALTAALTSARCETSQRTAMALLLIDVAASRAASPSISMTATRAPSRAKVAAMPLPKPDAAPVISATLLSRRMRLSLSRHSLRASRGSAGFDSVSVRPAQAVFGPCARAVFATDPFAVAEAIERREDFGIVHLALVGLAPRRHGRDLHMADEWQMFLEPP